MHHVLYLHTIKKNADFRQQGYSTTIVCSLQVLCDCPILYAMKKHQNTQNLVTFHTGVPLVTADADLSVETLNEILKAKNLFLPIEPLERGVTLADVIHRNIPARRQLRYGPIAHYLKAVTLSPDDDSCSNQTQPLVLGGATIKRATGYRLPAALIQASATSERAVLNDVAERLATLTVSLRPLPPARRVFLLVSSSFASACACASQLRTQNLALSAIMILDDTHAIDNLREHYTKPYAPSDVLMLVELEDVPDALTRQTHIVEILASEYACSVREVETWTSTHSVDAHSSCWCLWETLATNTLATEQIVALPYTTLPSYVDDVTSLAAKYRMHATVWGDAGIGRLHIRLSASEEQPLRPSELEQANVLLSHLAQTTSDAYGHRNERNKRKDQTHDRAVSISSSIIGSKLQATIQTKPHTTGSLVEKLQHIVGTPYVLTHPDNLACYAADASIAEAQGQPLAVVVPASTDEVSRVVKLAAHHKIALVPRGAGSGLAGGATPSEGCLVLAFTRMQNLSVNTDQMTAHVEAGVVTADLQQAAESHGLFYPPDPSSQTVSTIGGNIACNAGGPRCLKYGVTADYVLGLTVVLADGQVVRVGTGLLAQGSDSGMLNLLIGSEGTLALVTEATLRLLRQPPTRRTTLALFDNLEDACQTVEQIMAAGIVPAALELMDDTTIAVVEASMKLGLPRDAGALLLLQADGSPEAVEHEMTTLATLARQGGARSVQTATNAADESGLWKARRSIGPSLARLYPNKLGEDICVPVAQVATAVRRVKEIATQCDVPVPVFGHAGDGNLHPNILFNARDPQQVKRVWQAAEAIFAAALDLGGTLSGEHGIGTLKRAFMPAAMGDEALALQQAIKNAFDPHGLLNPGKVLPERKT